MLKKHKRIELVNNYLDKLNLSQDIQEYFLGRNILVTGGAGAIGSNLCIVLSKLVGEDGLVIIIDNLSANKSNVPIDFPQLENIPCQESRQE